MAEMLTIQEARNYTFGALDTTADLVALIDSGRPAGYSKAESVVELRVGQIVYVSALGDWRRGVVTKVAKTRANVALTTQSAVDACTQGQPGAKVRVQNAAYYPLNILVDTGEDAAELVEGQVLTEIDEAHQLLREDEFETPAGVDEDTVERSHGSAIVAALESVWDLIRKNHPEVPSVVLVTGAGIVGGIGPSRWGHHRPNGWEARTADEETVDHSTGRFHGEVFIAGETLAEGAAKTVQTMIHEAAHALAVARQVQDTSRQGRWHNGTFRKLAEELGLEYAHAAANKSIGFSAVTLTPGTREEYAAVIAELDAAIRLVIKAPGFMTGGGNGDDEGSENVHGAGRKAGGTKSNSNNVKATCLCIEPRIIRASRAVLAGAAIICDECDAHFIDRSDDE